MTDSWLEAKQKLKTQLEQEYTAVSEELGMVTDERHRVRLRRQLQQLEKEIQRIDQEIQEKKSYSQIDTPPQTRFRSLQAKIKYLIFWQHGLILFCLLLLLIISWFLRIKLYESRITKAPSAIDSVTIIISGDEVLSTQLRTELDRELSSEHWMQLGDDLSFQVREELETESDPHSLSLGNTLQITITPATNNKVNLTVELPSTPAYQLDFWQEVRDFRVKMPFEEAVNFSLASLAYSLGAYPRTVALLTNRQLPGEAKILLAQASLFENDFENSFENYDSALQQLDDIHQDKIILQMGQALALWRPVLGIPDSVKVRQEDCPNALKIYDDIILANESNGDAFILKEIAQLYCEPLGPADFNSKTSIRTRAVELNASQILVNFWEAKFLSQFQEQDDRIQLLLTQVTDEKSTIHISNAMLGAWYARKSFFLGIQCHQAKTYYQRFQDNLYTKLDQSIAQELLRELYTYSFAELC